MYYFKLRSFLIQESEFCSRIEEIIEQIKCFDREGKDTAELYQELEDILGELESFMITAKKELNTMVQ